ncbi:carboxypeptidase-like regulatory domain-containing protein [candidate division KSB1 bacterium]|nr:carboxypeptidase-like regulatory domain-containing protein [candidate division KSB1 bacterium]
MQKLIYLVISFIILLTGITYAGTTGKITGIVRDGETNDPLPGANIIIDGTTMGAATDMKGNFIIINIPPGTYTLKAMMMGYTTTRVTDVRVNIDLTTTVNVSLNSTVLDMGNEVTIVAERPLIQKDITSSRAIIGTEEMQQMPVENFQQVLQLQAGVVQGSGGEMHIRGGRSNEVTYLVDGISVTDPYSSSMSVSVENAAIQELELVSGTFNAEYGQAMSGIVNIVTKEGASDYHGEIRSYIGDYFSSNDQIFFNIDQINPFTIQDYQASLSGPVPFTSDKLTFFASGRRYDSDSYLYGIRRYMPQDSNAYSGTEPSDWVISESGDGELIPMSANDKWSGQMKLAYSFTPSMKLTYNFIFDDAQSTSYSHKYKLNPDGRATSYGKSYNSIVIWTHTLSPRTFYNLKYSNIYNEGKSYVYENPLDPRYVSDKRFNTASTYQFYMGGVSLGHYNRFTQTNVYKFELTSQVNNVHQIKGGVEVRWNKLHYDNFSVIVDQSNNYVPYIPDETMLSHDNYTNYPRDFSAYVQDKIELKDMIVNLGIRFEYFDPNGRLLTDDRDPNLWSPNKYNILNAVTPNKTYTVKVPVRIDPVTGEETIINPNNGDPMGSKHDEIRLLVLDSAKKEEAITLHDVTLVDTTNGLPIATGSMNWFSDTEPKYQISPRIGIAYPITDKGVIHISYGHFLQIPDYMYLYTNPEFEVNLGSGMASTLMGNADLKPQRTVSYEMGLQQQITNDIAIDITGFYKDIRNLLGTKIVSTYSQDMYAVYVNRDYGNVRGITLALKKRYSNYISGALDYTYSVAEGNASDPNTAYLDQRSGKEPEKQLVPLDWDQTHTLNLSVNVSKPRDWGISMIAQYGSGLPYTPTSSGLQGFQNLQTTFENSNRKPSNLNVDLKMHKEIFYNNLQFSLFFNIYNLFDRLNEDYVFSDTGRANYTLSQLTIPETPGPNTLNEYFTLPYYYSAPRSIRAGVAISY